MISAPSLGDTVFVSPNNRVRKISRLSRSGGRGSAPVPLFLTGAGPPPTYWESTEAVPGSRIALGTLPIWAARV